GASGVDSVGRRVDAQESSCASSVAARTSPTRGACSATSFARSKYSIRPLTSQATTLARSPVTDRAGPDRGENVVRVCVSLTTAANLAGSPPTTPTSDGPGKGARTPTRSSSVCGTDTDAGTI